MLGIFPPACEAATPFAKTILCRKLHVMSRNAQKTHVWQPFSAIGKGLEDNSQKKVLIEITLLGEFSPTP